MKQFAQYFALVILDASIAATGAWLLWLNAGTTVVDGSAAGNITAMMATTALIVLRQLALGSWFPHGGRGRDRARVERFLGVADVALLGGLVAGWRFAGEYLIGWVALFAAALLMLGSGLQLMFEVTGGREQIPGATSSRSLLSQRLASPEVMHLIAAMSGIVGVIVTTEVHRWLPSLINPLIVMLSVSIGSAGLIVLLSSSRRGRLQAMRLQTESRRASEDPA